jgi:HEAT repeat protein
VHGAELFAELVEAIREGGASASAAPEVIGSVPLLIARLDDPNDRVRSEAASALGWIGPDATGALPALEKRLSDPSGRVRNKSEVALARIRTGALEPGVR